MAGIGIGSAIADKIIEQGPIQTGYDTYTVQRGDSLSSIAAKILGSTSRWKEIFDINSDITDPNQISAGQIINIPAGAVASSTSPSKTLPGPTVKAVSVVPSGNDDNSYDYAEPASFLSSPAFLVGAAGVALLIIMMATKKV